MTTAAVGSCVHHWLLPPSGVVEPSQVYKALATGRCKKCGEERTFNLSPKEGFNRIEPSGKAKKGRAMAEV